MAKKRKKSAAKKVKQGKTPVRKSPAKRAPVKKAAKRVIPTKARQSAKLPAKPAKAAKRKAAKLPAKPRKAAKRKAAKLPAKPAKAAKRKAAKLPAKPAKAAKRKAAKRKAAKPAKPAPVRKTVLPPPKPDRRFEHVVPPIPIEPLKPPKRQIEQLHAGDSIVKNQFNSSRWSNKKAPVKAGEILEGMLHRATRNKPFDAEDVLILDHGILFSGTERLTDAMKERLFELTPEGGSIKFQDTKVGTEVFVYLGEQPKMMGQTQDSFDKHQSKLKDLWDELGEYWDDLDWFVWFETEELVANSP